MNERSGRRLVWWGLAGACLAVGAYLAMVRLVPGQRLDDVALEGRKATQLWPRRAWTRTMQVATPAALVLVGGWIVFVAWRRRGIGAAVVSAAALVSAPLLSGLLKSVLPRDHAITSWASPANTFPSGHTVVAATLALMAVAVVPPTRRSTATAVAVVAVATHCVAMVGSGWHRPSDVIGGLGLAVLISAPASTVVVARWRGPAAAVPGRPGWFELDGPSVRAIVLVLVGVTCWLLATRMWPPKPQHWFPGYLFATLVACLLATSSVVEHARLCRSADRAAPSPPDAATFGSAGPAGRSRTS